VQQYDVLKGVQGLAAEPGGQEATAGGARDELDGGQRRCGDGGQQRGAAAGAVSAAAAATAAAQAVQGGGLDQLAHLLVAARLLGGLQSPREALGGRRRGGFVEEPARRRCTGSLGTTTGTGVGVAAAAAVATAAAAAAQAAADGLLRGVGTDGRGGRGRRRAVAQDDRLLLMLLECICIAGG